MDPAQRMLEGGALPPGLRDLPEPPERVFVRGALPRAPAVAIVGTRDPSEEGRQYAKELGRRLAERGVTVISGGAEGIDTAAHVGAVAGGGGTLVVAPSSYDCPYPEKNAELYAQIVAEGGGYLSAFEHGVKAARHNFFQRNSFLVALANVVVVVEAPLRSGARNAAAWARKLGRPLLIVPHAPWNPRGHGCIAELQRGGIPLFSIRDVLRALEERHLHAIAAVPDPNAEDFDDGEEENTPTAELGSLPASVYPRARRTPVPSDEDLTDLERRVVEAVGDGHTHADQIVQHTSASAAEVNQALLLLTLKGQLVQDSSGRIRLTGA